MPGDSSTSSPHSFSQSVHKQHSTVYFEIYDYCCNKKATSKMTFYANFCQQHDSEKETPTSAIATKNSSSKSNNSGYYGAHERIKFCFYTSPWRDQKSKDAARITTQFYTRKDNMHVFSDCCRRHPFMLHVGDFVSNFHKFVVNQCFLHKSKNNK